MLNNIMSMFQNKNTNNIMASIQKLQQEIKASGLTPEQYAINILKNGQKIEPEKMEQFKIFAKQFGITDEQLNSFINNFEKK